MNASLSIYKQSFLQPLLPPPPPSPQFLAMGKKKIEITLLRKEGGNRFRRKKIIKKK